MVYGMAPPPPPPPPMMAAQEIMVTGRRVATQEELGDLKLYRVPMAVDLNPSSQKQVALLHQRAIAFTILYTARLSAQGEASEGGPLTRTLRFTNRGESGAGVPLPSGGLSLFAMRGGESLLLAQARMRDQAIGDKVEIAAGQSPHLRYASRPSRWGLAMGGHRARAGNGPTRLPPADAPLMIRSRARGAAGDSHPARRR